MSAKPFLFTTNPYEDENLLSYLVRLTEMNRYEFPSMTSMAANLCFQHQWHPRLIFFLSLNLKKLGEMTGVPEATLESLTYPELDGKGGETVRFGTHTLAKALVLISKPKVCPECLVEAAYARRLWDLSTYTACAKHRVRLVDTCPKCQTKLTWARSQIARCTCGFDLKGCERVPVEASRIGVFKLMQDKMTGAISQEPNPLSGLPFSKLVLLLDFMAAQTKAIRDTAGHFLAKQSLEEAHNLVIQAYEIFQSWPNNFHKFLTDYRMVERNDWASRERVTGIAKELGSFYKPLKKYKEPEYDFIRSEFERFVANWDGGVVKQGTTRRIDRSRYCSINAVADELGISIERLKKFFDMGLLRGKVLDRGSFAVYRIEKASVSELKAYLSQRLTVKEASKKLGIAVKLVERMVQQGLLTNAYAGTPLQEEMELSVTAFSVESILSMISSKVITKDDAELVSFARIVDRLHILKMSYLDCIGQIATGQIVPRAELEGTGLHRFYFDKAEIEEYMQKRKQQLLGDSLTLEQVKAELQVGKIHAIRIWIKNGLLKGNPVRKNGLPWWSIPRSEVEVFKEKYVLASRLAEQHGVAPQKMIKMLGEKGVRPVSGTTVDGSRVYLFVRSDAEAVGYNAANSWVVSRLIPA